MKNEKLNIWQFMIFTFAIVLFDGVAFGILFTKGLYLFLLLPVLGLWLVWIGLPAFFGRTLQNLKVAYKTNDIQKLIEELRKK